MAAPISSISNPRLILLRTIKTRLLSRVRDIRVVHSAHELEEFLQVRVFYVRRQLVFNKNNVHEVVSLILLKAIHVLTHVILFDIIKTMRFQERDIIFKNKRMDIFEI